jgi:hypothetical protein
MQRLLARGLSRLLLGLPLLALDASSASAAERSVPAALPTPVSAAAMAELDRGKTISHSTAARTLSPEDRAELRAIGLPKVDSAVVVLRRIRPTDEAKVVGRLRALAHAVDGFAPSEACDAIRSEGDGIGTCSGTAEGPIGRVPVQMPIAVSFSRLEGGGLRLGMRNRAAMQAKGLFGWTSIVDPDRLKLVYDLYPTSNGWVVYTRVGVEMSAHRGSATTITDALQKLDRWLTQDLDRL